MSISIHQGSILDATTDVIVNPANSFLRHGGGLAAIIAKAAAPWNPQSPYWLEEERALSLLSSEWNREQDEHPNIPTGAAGWTSAGAMSDRYMGIVHAVGPIWGGGNFYENALLVSAHAESLKLTRYKGAKSIAFPAISCGIFGFPVRKAALCAAVAMRKYALETNVEFWLFEDAHVEAYTAAFAVPNNAR